MSLKIPEFILKTSLLHQLGRFLYGKVFFIGNRGRFYGFFHSYDEARKHIGLESPSSYEDTDLTEVNLHSFMQTHLFDYPVMLNLLKLGNQIKSVIDFGGHIGVKYYAYESHVTDIHKLHWKVVDVPFCVNRGRKEAAQRGVTNLSFSSDISEAGECDLLLISGALQYVTLSIGELLDSMTRLPRFIIMNKLPVHFGPDCYTIENFGKTKIPYRLFNKNEFNSQLHLRGYINEDAWTIPSREISIPFHEKMLDQFTMEGHFWKMKENP